MDSIDSLMTMKVEKVRELLVHLDRATVLRLFDRMAAHPPRDGQLAAQVTALMLEVLTGERREHARRLWTTWLEPVLVRERIGPASGRPLPGSINATDAAACWAALTPRMAELVADVQERIAERARRTPLDRVLASPDAARWAETLRRRSAVELRSMRRDPAALSAFLCAANAQRARLSGIPCERLRLLDQTDVDTLLAVLEAMAAWTDVVWRSRPESRGLLPAVRAALLECGAPAAVPA